MRHVDCKSFRVDKRLAILHANCQGDPLAEALRASPEFDRRFTARVRLNYTREPIAQAELDACGLFLYQHLGPDWGGLASAELLKRLPPGCRSLCIPNMFFRGPWPLWSGAPGFDYRDVFLDHLLDLGLPRRDILHLYLHTPLAAKYDLAALLEETIGTERARQAHTPVPYLDYVLENFHARPLFHTINHPAAELLAHAATGILRLLGLEPPDQERLKRLRTGYEDFTLPIHPQAAAFYGLRYADAHTRYQVYGTLKTFDEYAAAYVDCRLAGIDTFIGYLQVA